MTQWNFIFLIRNFSLQKQGVKRVKIYKKIIKT